jgi:hypothetical protein
MTGDELSYGNNIKEEQNADLNGSSPMPTQIENYKLMEKRFSKTPGASPIDDSVLNFHKNMKQFGLHKESELRDIGINLKIVNLIS